MSYTLMGIRDVKISNLLKCFALFTFPDVVQIIGHCAA